MIRNYIKVALRNLLRQKGFTFINIFGLALGISCTALIGMWVNDELSYDRFHHDVDRMYRITATLPELKVHAAVSSAPLALAFKSQLPEIEDAVRMTEHRRDLMRAGEVKFEEQRIIYADSNFFKMFTFPFVKGDPQKALLNPDGIVVTESMAKKYFGTTDVLEKTIQKGSVIENLTITGVIADVPSNSHLQFDFVQPMRNLARTNNDLKKNVWDNFNFFTYIKLNEKANQSVPGIEDLEKKMQTIYKKNETQLKVGFVLQPLKDIHLHSNLLADIPGHGSAQNVRIFMVVAIFILVVACLNFMNLATARAARRAKEVGLRKVVGAIRPHLIGQFLAESLLVALFSLILALAIIWLVLPYFNTLGGKNLTLDFTNVELMAGLLGITVITGLLAGSYPALYLSGFVPAKVLKGNAQTGGGSLFRNTMVVAQFAVSISLIVGTAIVYRQLKYIQNLDLGYDKENLIYVPMTGDMWSKYEAFRTSLAGNRLTSQFAFISSLPTTSSGATIGVTWAGKDPNTQPLFFNFAVDENFEEVFKTTFVEGHGYSENAKADSVNIIVNETALKTMDMKPESAVGTKITVWGRERTIIGVVKDFNFKPVQEPIGPMFLDRNTWGGNAIIRTLPGETENTIKALEQISKTLNPVYPFDYSFLDQDIANLYKSEERLGKLFNVFAVLAIVISCLGLYGLSAYMAERRTRELGIRKVLGASSFQLVYLLSSAFTRQVLIATAIAIPIAWYGMSQWLDGFAYHISIEWTIFLIAFLSALMIAWLTVSIESIKAASTNPVTSLRSE
jgi:putative ABC transport system permease protein